jgi:hypothetical protein
MIKMYNNMFGDGTWKQELDEKDRIIALSTKVAKLRLKLDKQVIALATQEKKEVTRWQRLLSPSPQQKGWSLHRSSMTTD